MSSLHLAETLCARLCHDLGNPLCALGGMMELLSGRPEAGEAEAIAHEASLIAQDRLRLVRTAWGGETPGLDRPAFERLARSALESVPLDLSDLRMPMPRTARLLLNLLLVAADLPGLQGVRISGDAHELLLELTGAEWPPALSALWLGEEAKDVEPRRLPLLFAGLLGKASGHALAVAASRLALRQPDAAFAPHAAAP